MAPAGAVLTLSNTHSSLLPCCSPPLDDSPSLESVDTSVRNLRSATLSPAVFRGRRSCDRVMEL